ncbi:hypothetical protein EVAR_80036_1 [Eumeta japonica]|uniref:Uncharacterized protein n=1 Tax=Eumeta variegata TaxID=151549 RepID=A0A4C1WL06_EUMVA|nr:hypothetical protein EVAR_80036_1 [Eumeta japonica]
MAVNVSKMAVLLTGSQRIMPDQLLLRGQAVEWKICARYLGVHIDRSLRMVPQVDYVIQMSHAERAKLRPILASRLPMRTKKAIYKCYIRSRLTYCCTGLVCPLLGTAAPTSPGPAEHSAPYDCGGQVVRQKRLDRQRLGSRNARRVRQDAGATCLQSRRRRLLHLATQPSTTIQPTDKGYQLPRDLLFKCTNEEKV